jgi:predicted nucleotidyltransferase
VKDAHRRVEDLVRRLQDIVADDLVGVYLHGSLALGCFNPALSDLDLLVVTKQALTSDQRQALGPVLSRSGRVEISFLAAPSLRPWRHPAPYDLHFSSQAGLVGPA